jgi:threonine/homoserine/homoserine lactone efflux protein
MTLLGIFIQSFGAAFSGALVPGPLLTYDIQLAYKKGFWVGPQLILGHAILEAIVILGLIGGLGGYLRLPITQVILGISGGLMLVWMGYDLIWAESKKGYTAIKEQAAINEKVPAIINLNPVVAGIVVSLSNPYFPLWWAVIGLGIMTQSLKLGWTGIIVFYIAHELTDLVWYSIVSAAISKGRAFISDRFYRLLLIVCGVFLLFLAVTFLYRALDLIGVTKWFFNQAIDLFKHFRKLV